jgi:hypothetical protein
LKLCSKCDQEKPLSSFYARGDKKGTALKNVCSSCIVEENKVRRNKNPDKFKDYDLKRSFGIGISEYNEMFNGQGGCCKICKKHQTTQKRALAVDHCHNTGLIRGLLCQECNSGLGKFRDSTEFLESAIKYLNDLASHKTKVTGLYQLKNGG